MEGDHAEEEHAPETRIEVEIPKVSTDLGSDLYFVKLPNFLSVEPRSELGPVQQMQYKHIERKNEGMQIGTFWLPIFILSSLK